MKVTVKRNGNIVFESEIHAYSVREALAVHMLGGYKDVPMQKDEFCEVLLYNNDGSCIPFYAMFMGYFFNMSTYQKQNEDGTQTTETGITTNDLMFKPLK